MICDEKEIFFYNKGNDMNMTNVFNGLLRTCFLVCAVSMTGMVSANDPYFGQNGCPSPCGVQPVCAQSCGVPPCAAPDCAWAYNPSAQQRCGGNPCGGFLDNLTGRVDFLWWRPYSEGTQLGTEETLVTVDSSGLIGAPVTHTITDSTSIKYPNFKFDPGFRLGFGYYCPSNCWDVALVWTEFHTKANAFGTGLPLATMPTVTVTDIITEDLFFDDWTREFGAFPNQSQARWTMNLDLIDLELGQKFYVNRCFILRPFLGLRFARIDQNYHVNAYANGPRRSESGISNFVSTVKSKNDFRGGGPRVGLDLEIDLGCSLFLVGRGSASLLYGTFDRYSTQVLTTLGTGAETATATYEARGYSDRDTILTADVSFGLEWQRCFECCNQSYPFALSFVWEQNAFYGINHFNFVPYATPLGSSGGGGASLLGPSLNNGVTYNSAAKTGNLLTQGLTLSATLGF